jgi:hypothetical protein
VERATLQPLAARPYRALPTLPPPRTLRIMPSARTRPLLTV